MKRTKPLSIALGAIMALTVLSAAGVLTAQASPANPTPAELAAALDCTWQTQHYGWQWGYWIPHAAGNDQGYGSVTIDTTQGFGGSRVDISLSYDGQGQAPELDLSHLTGPGTLTWTWAALTAQPSPNNIQEDFYVSHDGGATWNFVANKTDSTPTTFSYFVNGPVDVKWRYTVPEDQYSTADNHAFVDHVYFMPTTKTGAVLLDFAALQSTVMSTPSNAFSPSTKAAVLATIDVAMLQAARGKYSDAETILQTGVLPNVAAQGPVYQQVNILIQELQSLSI
jgi:hypothetical protein